MGGINEKNVKRLFAVVSAVVMTTGMLAGCGSVKEEPVAEESGGANEMNEKSEANEPNTSGKTIEMEVGYVNEALDKFRRIIDDFTKESGIAVELVTPGSDYETVMKTRMASGDMPDVFMTHGWSIARYKEYLLEMNDQPWFGTIGESIKEVITDSDGKAYVLPVTQGVTGIDYNKDVLEAAGVDIASLATMDGFFSACEKIKASGVSPIFIGGKDDWTTASLLGTFAPTYLNGEARNLLCSNGFAKEI